jgi:hypothetical protein
MTAYSWSVTRTALTFLFDDLGHGVPLPFEPNHPYTTTAERDACREQTYLELAGTGLVRDGVLAPHARRVLSTLARGPVALVAMGALGEDVLLARACWDGRNAFLAQQTDADTVTVTDVGHLDLVDAVVRLVPDTEAARGISVRVPLDGPADVRDSIYNDFGPNADSRAVAAMFSNGVSRCGAFIPVHEGTERPPVIWFDTETDTGIARWFGTTTKDSIGTPWTTYVPGDNSRIRQALRAVAIFR